MVGQRPWWERYFPETGGMLGRIRTLCLSLLLIWPIFGLWGLAPHRGVRATVLAAAAIVLVEVWLYAGYRRQRFPPWSWIGEGICICLVAKVSDYGTAVGLCFVWVNFRALYGGLWERVLAATVLTAITTTGIPVLKVAPDNAVPLLFIALISVAVNHLLVRGSSARARSSDREGALSSAGAGFVACTTRAEALDVTLGAAISMDRDVSAALIFTITGPTLHAIAAAGEIGTEAAGWVTEVAALPVEARAVLKSGSSVVISGASAEAMTAAIRLPRHPVLILAPLAAHGHVFGLLVLALDGRPADDLSPAVSTLAGEAALTLDQLLSQSRLSIVVEHSPDALMLAGEAGHIRVVNPAAAVLLKSTGAGLLGRDIRTLLHPDDVAVMFDTPQQGISVAQPCRIRGSAAEDWTETEALIEYVSEHDGSRSMVFTARDVSERRRLELELRHAQKLESIGRLAAGIAHEINTPIQFVADNVRFLDTAFADFTRLYAAYGELVTTIQTSNAPGKAADYIDIDFVAQEVPLAISQTLDGINQVADIVRAMKAFGHPGTDKKSHADLNEAIRHTLVVATNEIKFVADVETDLGDVPLVCCHIGDINQVVLNLVVNAAHAIGSADRGRGTIRITTRLDGAYAVIEVADTGTGVPAEIAGLLFDPFFTTKDVGVGTGQGLALVRTLVTDRHAGTITFTTEVGAGTTFTVRLPVDGDADADGSLPSAALTASRS
jgi:PAS domain S-box-containing protein